jgi:hypothetical protein
MLIAAVATRTSTGTAVAVANDEAWAVMSERILLGPGTAMHDVHTMKLGRWAPPWWGVGAVPAPPGHRCDQTGLPVRP